MARKIFVSYKYADEQVQDLDMYDEITSILGTTRLRRNTRVRDYVDLLQERIGASHINLGEKDGESLADFSDEQIQTSLKKKIFQSSITVVLISRGMVSPIVEYDQWVPWEISYSLRNIVRESGNSRTNAVLGVVLPDRDGSYEWYYTNNPICNSITHHTEQLFEILKKNMFNIKNPEQTTCNGTTITHGEASYIKTVKWNDFVSENNLEAYIDKSIEIRDNKQAYNLMINLK
jgi:hypothetical protein